VFFIVLPIFFLPAAGAAAGLFTLTIAYLAIAAPQIGILLYIVSRGGRRLADFGLRRPDRRTWGWLGLSLLGAVVMLALGSLVVWAILGKNAGGMLFRRPFPGSFSPITPLLLILLCAAVGYREEVFFRAYLVTRLGDLGVKPGWAVAGSALVFGMAHFYEGIFGVALAGVVGAFFGFVFVRSKDLHAVAGAHALYNLGVWLLSYTLTSAGG
jgi:membrane protease YdiL (CAAX protease family)